MHYEWGSILLLPIFLVLVKIRRVSKIFLYIKNPDLR